MPAYNFTENTTRGFDEAIGLNAKLIPLAPIVGPLGRHLDWDFDMGFSGRRSSIFPWAPTVPPYKISINGKAYAVDLSFEPYRREAYRHRSIISQRESLNFDNIAGENVVNTSGLWRRNFNNWDFGAGQLVADHRRSAENRFYSSKGVNPWVPNQLTLHYDTVKKYNSRNSDRFLRVHSAGPYQYFLEHDSVYFVDTRVGNYYSHPIRVTGLPVVGGAASYYRGICHNDTFIFIACGSSGIYYAPLGSTDSDATKYVAVGNVGSYDIDAFDSVFWGADNLWATSAQFVLNFGGSSAFSAGSAPGASNLMAVNVGSNWRWTGWAEGNSSIYLGGYNSAGGVITDGSVYRIAQQTLQTLVGAVTTTSTTFFAPMQALPLPPGEYPTALHPYLNYIILGTNRGVRLCQTLSVYDPTATALGDLKSGPYIPINPDTDGPLISSPVTSITSNDRFIYFAWNNYDSGSTGVGRADIQTFIDALAPAYASDLMVTGQGNIYLDWDYENNAPLIAVSDTKSSGIYNISPNPVAYGEVNSGWVTFDIPENKTLLQFQPQFTGQIGSMDLYITPDKLAKGLVSTWSGSTMSALQNIDPLIETDKAQVTLRLYSAAGVSPKLNRWTIKGMPNVASETQISCVIDLFRSVAEEDCIGVFNPYVEYINLDTLRRNQTIIPFVEGPLSANVIITQLDWLPENRRDDAGPQGFNGVLVVYMQTLNGYQISAWAEA